MSLVFKVLHKQTRHSFHFNVNYASKVGIYGKLTNQYFKKT